MHNNKTLINNAIRAFELRVIDSSGKNLGVIKKEEALSLAKSAGLDLIEISNNGEISVARIADYGKHQYDTSKKLKDVKSRATSSETKNVQLSVGISEHDIEVKTNQAAEWIKEGHRVKFELQLKGRGKFMEESFLKERLSRVLAIIPCEYRIDEPLKKIPKGYSIIIDKK